MYCRKKLRSSLLSETQLEQLQKIPLLAERLLSWEADVPGT